VIVVVAGREDAAARRLAVRWSAVPARVLTVADVATAGWRVTSADPGEGRAVVAGELVDVASITGVLIRLPAVSEGELPMMRDEDRAYAATEMTAFLSYWLSTLACPVLNAPSNTGLCGPGWRSDQWLAHAHRHGIPARSAHRHTPPFRTGAEEAPAARTEPVGRAVCTVVGDHVLGAADPVLRGHARTLARTAGVEMVTAVFRGQGAGARLVEAHTWVDVMDAEVSDALLAHLTAAREVGR
jgi:hypothetical protein